MMFGTDERTRFVDAMDGSRTMLLAKGPGIPGRPAGPAAPSWTSGPRSTTHFTVSSRAQEGGDSHQVDLKVVREGRRIAYAVDLFGRIRNGWESISQRAPRTTGVELAATLIAVLDTVAFTLPAVVSELALEPAHRPDEAQIWIRGDARGRAAKIRSLSRQAI
jgi:hypothetical protein